MLLTFIGMRPRGALLPAADPAHRKECPEFNATRACRRIAGVTALSAFLVILITVLVLRYAPPHAVTGFLLGMIAAFVLSIPRMSPNHERNRSHYESAYADCYPPADPRAGQSGEKK